MKPRTRKLIQDVMKESQEPHTDDYIYPKRKEFQEELAAEIIAAVHTPSRQEFMTVLTSMVMTG